MAKRDPVAEYLSEIGRRGGKAKVKKGVATLSKKQRSERAKKAAAARWADKKAAPCPSKTK